jgi:hypothetical protein
MPELPQPFKPFGRFRTPSSAARFCILISVGFRRIIMPDDKTLAMILAICDLIKHNGSSVGNAVEAYERAMKDVIEYRRSKGMTEVGGLPAA